MTTASTSFAPALDLTEGVRDPVHYLRELECLRGLAILLVFPFHAWGISGLLLTLASLLLLERVLARVATMGDSTQNCTGIFTIRGRPHCGRSSCCVCYNTDCPERVCW